MASALFHRYSNSDHRQAAKPGGGRPSMGAVPVEISGRVSSPTRESGAVVPIVGSRFCRASEERLLTVQKTSLFYPGDGFAVYEHRHCRSQSVESTARSDPDVQGGGWKAGGAEETGELVFRVDSYGPDSRNHHHGIGKRGVTRDEVTLMDADGDCILTVRRKWLSLHQRWEGFLGEGREGQKPLFSVRREFIIARAAGICVEVYGSQPGDSVGDGTGHLQYRVEGSFPRRCCAVYEVWTDGDPDGGGNEPGEAVAEIRRKVVTVPTGSPGPDPSAATSCGGGTVTLGRDVFCLRVAPGFDAAFAMGLILILDRMTGDGEIGEEEQSPAPADGIAYRGADSSP